MRLVLLLNTYLVRFLALMIALLFTAQASAQAVSEAEFFEAGKIFETAMMSELSQSGITVKMDFQRKVLQASYDNFNIYLATDGGSEKQEFNHLLTQDAYVMILCHELGHGIGGLSISQSAHTSIEGQADYFAVNVCLKKIFSNDKENAAAVKSLKVDNDLSSWCKRHISDPAKINWCLRSGMAALALTSSNVHAANSTTTAYPKINTPDCSQNVLKYTFGRSIKSKHPSNQCRLDTYMRALVDAPPPPCWYAIENPENSKFFERIDQLYATKNICQQVCQNLPAHVSDKEREQRCLSAPCTRMIFPLIDKNSSYASVDNDYHQRIQSLVEKIVAAENSYRNDCSSKKENMITLEMLIENSPENASQCLNTDTSSAWRGPYIEKSLVQSIIVSGKDWCTSPKLNNDCADSKFFERTLKNCIK